MQLDYGMIKAMAKANGVRVTDLLALAPQNDPFYAGTETNRLQGEWFHDIWQRARYSSRVHLRRIHYWIVSQSPAVKMHNGQPYENTEKCWDYLGQASKMARYLELVPIENIADNKNPKPIVQALYSTGGPGFWIDTPDFADLYFSTHGITSPDYQPYHLEIWCEKSTMNDVLQPLCQRYGANLVTFEGECSITACYELLERVTAATRPTRILYISDFDPAGKSIPNAMSRKVEYMIGYFTERERAASYDIRVTPIMLTAEQVDEYSLPRIPIKETEKRAAKFEQAFGTGAVELDALEALYPGELARIISAELQVYYSEEAAEKARDDDAAMKAAIQAQIDTITAPYKAQIDALKGMIAQLDSIQVDTSEYAPEIFPAEVHESDHWLFDSSRDYFDQLTAYKAHKGLVSQD